MSAASFNWEDPLLLDSQLTDEERMVREAAHAYCQEKLAPRVLEAFRHEKMDVSIFPEMGALGLLGPTIPTEYGGSGLNYVCYGLIAREVERIDSGYRSMMSVQSSLVMVPINEFGSDAQKQKYLPKLATGEWIGCFGLTEPNHGSDPANMETRAVKTADGYQLTGNKIWITNSPVADVFIIWAKCVGGDHDGRIRGFILEKGMKGLSAPAIHGKVGLRASVTGEIVMDEVWVSDDHMMPGVSGLKGPFTCLNSARYGIAWGAIGAALDCYDSALRYSKERKQFGRPIGGFQLQQKKLAEMITEITKAQLLTFRLGQLRNEGRATTAQISMAKRNNVDMALQVARDARQIHGGMGITNEYPIMRHMMNLESVVTYEGTHDIHLLITGMDITGENAFK
jgi:glutaryl-CoA dehydrogenase